VCGWSGVSVFVFFLLRMAVCARVRRVFAFVCCSVVRVWCVHGCTCIPACSYVRDRDVLLVGVFVDVRFV
jgi:hypothetical protein